MLGVLQELDFRAGLAQDKVAALRAPEGATGFMGCVGRLDNLGGEGEILTGQDPDARGIIAWGLDYAGGSEVNSGVLGFLAMKKGRT